MVYGVFLWMFRGVWVRLWVRVFVDVSWGTALVCGYILDTACFAGESCMQCDCVGALRDTVWIWVCIWAWGVCFCGFFVGNSVILWVDLACSVILWVWWGE